eukprot:6205647-Pleurochrysis_carterae.AAC.3
MSSGRGARRDGGGRPPRCAAGRAPASPCRRRARPRGWPRARAALRVRSPAAGTCRRNSAHRLRQGASTHIRRVPWRET